MERKTTKKLLAILSIIMILTADFFTLGSYLVTYATQVNNEIEGYENIHFSTYFKEEEKEVKQINKSIKDEDLKLYAKIGVNSDVDCLEDIQIKLKDSNFNIISSNKGTLDGNTVKLDYIGAGTSVELELGIRPIFSNKVPADMLLKTEIELNAKYKHADEPEGETIQAVSEIGVKFEPAQTTKAELVTDIITNKVLAVNGINQRVVQVLIKSRLTENEYPTKQTTLNVSIPQLGGNIPQISVLSIQGTSIENYAVSGENLQIILENKADANNQINWNKNVYDEIVVTYIYPETVDASKIEVVTNSEIKLHNLENTYTATYTKGIENQEPNSIIMGRTEITTAEMYKGQLYAGIEAQYNTNTSIVIINANIVDKIVVHEGLDTFGTTEGELTANTKYVTTEINLEKMIDILGEEGNITIKNGEAITTINKETAVDENGNVVINHSNISAELEIITSKPAKSGIIEINHTKTITNNNYTRTELQKVKTLNVKNTTTALLKETKIVESAAQATSIELKETTSKAQLTIENNKKTLSTTETNEMTLGITLITDGIQYDLYKNPKITLKFPDAVETVKLITTPSKQNANEFAVKAGEFNKESKTMQIELEGEQTAYPKSTLTQPYIQLDLEITLSQLATNQTDKITMSYMNENATQYDGGKIDAGIIEKTVQISAQPGLLKMYNLSLNENTSITQTIKQQITSQNEKLKFETILVNNTDSELHNVRILGKLPTTGNIITGQEKINTLNTILKNIEATNATIYYTENATATLDTENTANGWTTNLASLANAKLYLIKLETLNKGTQYTISTEVQIPSVTAEQELESYTEYEVIYNTDTATDIKETSRKIGLVTYVVSDLEVDLTAKVGNDKLNNGDKVKEGEVIQYTVNVSNTGKQPLTNIELQTGIPEGTVLVEPMKTTETLEDGTIQEISYVYIPNAYYEEITDSAKINEKTHITIPELEPGATYTKQYEVRVNSNNAEGTEISNKTILQQNNLIIRSKEFKNRIEESNIRVTIKRTIDETIQLVAGGKTRYTVYVENLSNSQIQNLEMKILSNEFNPEIIENSEIFLNGADVPEKIFIDKIEANDLVQFSIYGSIDKQAKEINTSVVVNDLNGNTYRSNAFVEKLPYTEATINLTSNKNGECIKDGDIVEYVATVQNTGDIEGWVTIEENIPEYLEVQSIYINDELVEDNTDGIILNNIRKSVNVKPGETAQLKIITKVGYISKLYHGKVISNSAIVKMFNVEEDVSERVTHILISNSLQNESIENVISGLAWFDENENTEKDSNEEGISLLTVKLFDISTGTYVTTKTENNGEYTFTKIKDGSYLVVFEYDKNKYQPTTTCAEGEIVGAIEINDLTGNIFNIDIGLKETTEVINPEEPENSEKPENPEQSGKPSEPQQPENSEKPEQPKEEIKEEKKAISGLAWLDSNRNGQKDSNETLLSGIKAKLYDVSTKKYLLEVTTDENGKYIFNEIEKGSYIVIFEYSTEKYKPTAYLAEGVDTALNSKVVLKKINVNGQEIVAAVTDTINVQEDVENINIGLKENLVFDLELNKYVSRIVVQTSKETKAYDYEQKTLAKAEIHRKQIQGALVVLEYTIKVKNNGEIAGNARNIVDYLPSGLTFSSELNKDWYLSGNYLYTKNLENVELKPGEEKEIKLILTKTMTNENVGLINNRAEIYQDYNIYGESDIDSIPNNQASNEDDFGTADVIIQVATGGRNMTYTILLMINVALIAIAIKLMIKNRIIKLPTKKGRR